jgi:hypothetical protein
MILYRRRLGLFDQELLAHFLKVKITPEAQAYFTQPFDLCPSEAEEVGINTIASASLVNDFFAAYQIPLTAQSVRASEIPDLARFIRDHLEADHDLWIEYKSHEIHSEEAIHDNVIESMTQSEEKTSFVLIDPYSEHKTRFEVSLEKVQRAISAQFDRESGFLVIRKNNK